ncbi:protein PXR1 isoform X1 [Fagus crenata]
MKNWKPKDEQNSGKINGSDSIKMKSKNKKRLGGGGLSLEAFANAKSKGDFYNPALISKEAKGVYKNAKYAKKYKKLLKQQSEAHDISSAIRSLEAVIQAKKEEREEAEAQRKAVREKMFRKMRAGQPFLNYRIEHLLETIQNSFKN